MFPMFRLSFFMTSLDPHTGIMLANGRWCTWGVPRHAWLRRCVWWCTDGFLSVQSLRAQQGWRLWENFFSCVLCLCSTSMRIHENTTSIAGDGKSWFWHVAIDRTLIDCSTLLPRYANKLDGKAWCGWWNLEKQCVKCSRRAQGIPVSGPEGRWVSAKSVTAQAQMLVNSRKRCAYMSTVHTNYHTETTKVTTTSSQQILPVQNLCVMRSWKPMLQRHSLFWRPMALDWRTCEVGCCLRLKVAFPILSISIAFNDVSMLAAKRTSETVDRTKRSSVCLFENVYSSHHNPIRCLVILVILAMCIRRRLVNVASWQRIPRWMPGSHWRGAEGTTLKSTERVLKHSNYWTIMIKDC